MRKIEREMNEAIGQRRSWKSGNTEVVYESELDETYRARMEHARVYLHGNHIGTYVYRDVMFIVNAETFRTWPTRTTKSRLNALGGNYANL